VASEAVPTDADKVEAVKGQEVERMSHHSYEEIAASEANSEVSKIKSLHIYL
jgi:hypothetical protein